jgi:chaperonin GroES
MHVTPLHDRILVRRLEEGEQKVGGIIIPDSAKEKPQQGQVIAVGKGRLNDEGQRISVAVRAGDRILFGKYAQEITLAGESYLILREEEVLAVIGPGGMNEKTQTHKKTTKTSPKKQIAKKITKPKKKAKRT